jgi:hypothetical protein
MTINPRLHEVLSKYHDDPKSAVWNCHGTWVAYHKDLEIIAAKAGIEFDAPQVLEADGAAKCAALCVTGRLGERSEWSVGEAAPGNNKNAYPFAMAEKRAKDRVILKLIGLHGLLFSEEESDSFKADKPKEEAPTLSIEAAITTLKASPSLEALQNFWKLNYRFMKEEFDEDSFRRVERAKDARKAVLYDMEASANAH